MKNYYLENLKITKNKIKESVNQDNIIAQTINTVEETRRAEKILLRRLRIWNNIHIPEINKLQDKEFLEKIQKTKKPKDSMGAELGKEDINSIMLLAKQIKSLQELIVKEKKYLEKIIKKYCPNMQAVAGTVISAKLIEQAGSLKKLSEMPASKIQTLGAEKALFRHMKKGSKAPKYGIILEHEFIQSADKDLKGKASRILANKISLAVKIDYFKGEYAGDKLKKELKI